MPREGTDSQRSVSRTLEIAGSNPADPTNSDGLEWIRWNETKTKVGLPVGIRLASVMRGPSPTLRPLPYSLVTFGVLIMIV